MVVLTKDQTESLYDRFAGIYDRLLRAGIFLTRLFGVSRDYEDFKPWEAARSSLEEEWFEQHLAAAAYSFVGRKNARAMRAKP